MRIVAFLVAVSLSLLLCVAAVCQDSPPPAPAPPADNVDSLPAPPPAPDALPAPPPAPEMTAPAPPPAPAAAKTPWLMQRRNPYVIVGPSDSQGKPKMIAGKITVISRPDNKAKTTSVAVLIDDRPVGSANGDRMGLYGMDFDTSTLTEGVHTVKSVGADATGKQVWTATTTIDVRNKQAAASAQPAVVATPRPVKPATVVNVTPVTAPAQPTPTVPGVQLAQEPTILVGPTNSKGKPTQVRGTFKAVANPPATANVARVMFYWDNKYFHEDANDWTRVNTAAGANGLHSIKAVGKDETGNEVWTASTHVEVANRKPVAASKLVKPAAPAVMLGALAKTFASTKYGFSVKQPAGWTAKDKTAAMKPKKAGNGWIEFTPAKSAGLAVNVRRMRVQPGTTAGVFAKYNPYVNKWDRKTVLGAEAFSTNTDTGNKIIHRLIVVKGSTAWMLNCVDANGKTMSMGQNLFDSMVASFSVPAKPAAKPAHKP